MYSAVMTVLIQHDRWIGELSSFSHYQGWLGDILTLALVDVLLWIASLIVGKCWPVDFVWSSWPGLLCGLILRRSHLRIVSPKQSLFVAVIVVWGLRLTINFISRSGIGHEDWRYTEMREAMGPKLFPLLSLPVVFLSQSLFLYVGCLPLYGVLRTRFSVMSTMDLIGLSIMLLAFVFETAADEQLDKFKAEPKDGQKGDRLWIMEPITASKLFRTVSVLVGIMGSLRL